MIYPVSELLTKMTNWQIPPMSIPKVRLLAWETNPADDVDALLQRTVLPLLGTRKSESDVMRQAVNAAGVTASNGPASIERGWNLLTRVVHRVSLPNETRQLPLSWIDWPSIG